MVGLKIGLDIGTGSVIAAVENKGVILSEPAVLALERETGEVIEAGKKAGIPAFVFTDVPTLRKDLGL